MKNYKQEQAEEKANRVRFFENNGRLRDIIKPLRSCTYTCDIGWRRMDGFLARWEEDYGGMRLNPDFQRGHVWTEAQQLHYIENALRGVVPQAAFIMQLNCPNFETYNFKGDLEQGFECIDGLQRLTAVQKFLGGDIKPFGLSLDDFTHSSYCMKSCTYRFHIEVFTFTNRSDLLQHYIDINTGGTPHSAEEIERVRELKGVNHEPK
jgi:hypothetical protein